MTGTFIHPLISFAIKLSSLPNLNSASCATTSQSSLPVHSNPRCGYSSSAGICAQRHDAYRQYPLSGLHRSRHSCAKCSLRRYFLRNQRDLGTGPGNRPEVPCQPTPRTALVLGKGLSAGIRTLSQAIVVYGLSLFLGVRLNWSPLALLNVFVVVVLAATLFSNVLSHHCLHCEDPRALHGCWPGSDDAAVLRKQCYLSTDIMPAWLK